MKKREIIYLLRSMVFLKILSCSLIFIVAAASSELRKLDETQHYNIHFVLYVNADIFHGECNISISIPYETQDICFYTENLSIIKIVIINTTQISEENEKKIFVHRPNKFTYDTKKYITNISLPYYLSSGYYTLYVKFAGLLGEDGGFRTYINELNERMWLVATHYHTFARRLFPLLKDTIFASYNISIKHHKNYTALSNMPVQEINTDDNDMQWTRFKTAPIMPVYFIVANVIRGFILDTKQNAKLWCRSSLIPHVQFAYSVALKVTLFLEDKFPSYIKKTLEVNHVAIPFQLSDEEDIKLGIVLYREADIIFNQEIDDEIRKFEITQVVAYKVIYEWLYDAIDPSKKLDFWLSKGFATFLGNYVANKIFRHFRIHDFSLVQMQQAVLHWSTKDTWPLTTESGLNSSFEIPRYIKASIMFRLLQIIFTEGLFKFDMRWYIRNPYISSNFSSIMQSVLDVSIQSIYNLEDKIINWTQLNHYPVINIKRTYNTNWLNVSIENSTNMWIFVNITTQSHSNLNKTLPKVWLLPHKPYQLQTIDFIDKNDWVLANIQQSGCYRVNYDAENWSRLSKYLNFNAFDNIHVLDRAKIIDDTFHFLMTGRLNSTVFLDISHYLCRDADYIAWYPMFKNLEYMSNFFVFPESALIKTEIMQSLKEILSKIGYPNFKSHRITDKDVFTKYLRQELVRWLCIIGDYHCLSTANKDLRWYLFYRHSSFNRNESLQYKIWTEWKEWTFCNGLMMASNDTWMKVFHMYSRKLDSSVLKFLACSNNSSIILQYMYLMANMTNVTAIDHINSFCTIVGRHANNNLVDFILDDLEKVKPKEISFITALTIIINHIYSEKQLKKVFKFLNLKENMKNIIMDVNRKLALRWCQIGAQLYQYRYLIKDFDDIFRVY